MTVLTQPASTFPAPVADGVRAAVACTFASICGAELAPTDDAAAPTGPAVVGGISFLGDVTWTFSLAIPAATATALAAKFAGFDIPFDSADMSDVVGELANVVAGDIVAQLDRRGVKAQMSLPMVTRGSDVEVMTPGHRPAVCVGWASPQGGFWYKLVAAKADGFEGRRPGT